MEPTLYLECYSGISGDMMTAALLDLGADEKVLLQVLNSLSVQGFRIEINRVMKSGIDVCDFDVILEENDNHDHDMEYLYGHMNGHSQVPSAMHTVLRGHVHSDMDIYDELQEHTHSHVHRGMREIREIIEQASMTERARTLALNIFTILAEAESEAHHVPVEEVHFHEVGAVDSIVDIIAAAVCLDNLNIKNVIVPEMWEGKGTVRCQHGILPIPVPAVVNIMQAHALPIRITDIMGELVTPTGAAIIAAIKTSTVLPENFSIKKIGLGAGKREYECPGFLRAMLIEEKREATAESGSVTNGGCNNAGKSNIKE